MAVESMKLKVILKSKKICSDLKLKKKENKVSYCFHCFPIYLPLSDGTRYHDLSFNIEFQASFFTFIKRFFSSSSLSAITVVSSALSEVIEISPGNLDSSL